jgi:hypothetical protein
MAPKPITAGKLLCPSGPHTIGMNCGRPAVGKDEDAGDGTCKSTKPFSHDLSETGGAGIDQLDDVRPGLRDDIVMGTINFSKSRRTSAQKKAVDLLQGRYPGRRFLLFLDWLSCGRH